MSILIGLKVLALLTFLLQSVTSMPPLSDGGFDANTLLPFGSSVVNPDTGHLEVRGVFGGRMKRYVIERGKTQQCCRKMKCKTVLGEVFDKTKCKCKRCPSGQVPIPVPGQNSQKCQKECPAGLTKTPGGQGCCPAGQKPNTRGDGCEIDCGTERPGPDGKCPPKNNDEEERKKRKGKCLDGQMLDPREGGQDTNTPSPKCVLDDYDKCRPGEIPETRSENDNDPNTNIRCAKPDPEKKAKCNPKKHWIEVAIWEALDGSTAAGETCQRTRQYNRGKTSRIEPMRNWLQEKWNREKPIRDLDDQNRRKKEEQERLQKERDEQNWRDVEKESEKNRLKKTRMGECLPLVGLLEAVSTMAVPRSVALDNRDEESPYEWVADYFDEDFVQLDDILEYWPTDLEFDPNVNVDNDSFIADWAETFQSKLLKDSHVSCNGRKRCSVRRDDDTNHTQEQINAGPSETSPHRRWEFPAEEETQPQSFPHEDPEKRNPVLILEILIDIALFAGRMAAALLSRLTMTLARISPRLAEIAKDGTRLFQVAARGQGARGSLQSMKNAARRITQNKHWKECLKGGKPS